MKHPQLRLFKAAARLQSAYLQRTQSASTVAIEEFSTRLMSKLEHARRRASLLSDLSRRGWTCSTASIRAEYADALGDLLHAVQQLQLSSHPPRADLPLVGDLFRELAAARDEFGEVLIHGSTIGVLTESITLHGIELGAFRIVLDIEAIAHAAPEHWYRVIPDEPFPSQSDVDVTHPHVSSEHLCPGEAAVPIRSSLSQGRLSEFFLLVRSVLQTYNPESAYVRLENWEGVACADCGYATPTDELCYCSFCEQDHCDQCIRSCVECSASGCRNCLNISEVSDDWVCSDCLTTCDRCGVRAARIELNEQCICSDCEESLDESESNQEVSDDHAAESQPTEQPQSPAECPGKAAAGTPSA